jgi:hypothetical protein
MDEITAEALTNLDITVNGLFASLNPLPEVEILPTRIVPTGLGGYVGEHEDPIGDLRGRRIEALALITVQGNTPNLLNERALAVQNAVLSLSRAEMVQKGILRSNLDPDVLPAEEDDRRKLGFRLVYEFIKVPEDGEGIIQEIPINLSTG